MASKSEQNTSSVLMIQKFNSDRGESEKKLRSEVILSPNNNKDLLSNNLVG